MFRRQALALKLIRQSSSIKTISADQKPKWDLLCGICLERKPLVSRPPREIEMKFAQMLREIEEENSLKSDHELRNEADIRRAKEMEEGNMVHGDMSKGAAQTALDFEDASRKELSEFILAPCITEADEKNDTKSTDRKLAEHLLYVTKEKLGQKDVWTLPHGQLQGEESLRQAAERILRESCGKNIKAKFYGNAPCGFYKYKYPKVLNKDAVGVKIFFMKAQYLRGTIDNNQTSLDFSWNTISELSEKMHDAYFKAISMFVIDDEK